LRESPRGRNKKHMQSFCLRKHRLYTAEKDYFKAVLNEGRNEAALR
jgi:hypothetical protein